MKKILLILLVLGVSHAVLQISSSYTLSPGKQGVIMLSFSDQEITRNLKVAFNSIDSPLSANTCSKCIEYSTLRKACIKYSDDCYDNIGDISLMSKDIAYKVFVPDNISSGTYLAQFSIKYTQVNLTTNTEKDIIVIKRIPLTINNNLVKPDIKITKLIMPQTVKPGQEFNITIFLTNLGSQKAKNVVLQILNIDTISSSNKLFVGDILPNKTTKIIVSLIASPNTIPGVHTILFNISYSDVNQLKYFDQSSAGILIDGPTEFQIYIQSVDPEVFEENSSISILFGIANTGIVNAKSIGIMLNPSEDYNISNVNQDFIGDLDSGDFTSTSFKIIPNKEGEINLNLTLNYTTPSGKHISFNTIQRIVVRYSKTKKESNGFFTISLFIIAVIIGIIIYIKKK